MAIIDKPKPKNIEDFINGAPDAKAQLSSVPSKMPGTPPKPKTKKIQFTMTIQPDLLGKIDAQALKMGQTRAAVIALACYKGLESGL